MKEILIYIFAFPAILLVAILFANALLYASEFITSSILRYLKLLEYIRFIVAHKKVIEEYEEFISDDELHAKILKLIMDYKEQRKMKDDGNS